MNSCVTIDQATAFLQQLVGLSVSSVECSEEGWIVLGLGKKYQLSNLAIDETGRFKEERNTVSEYVLLIKSMLHVLCDELSEQLYTCAGDESRLRQIEMLLAGRVLKKIRVIEKNAVELCIDHYCVRVLTKPEEAESWRVQQPGTEEDSLIGSSRELLKCIHLQRRWSQKHAMTRGQWHSFPLAQNDFSGRKASLRILRALVGAEISYGKKSADMNLFDLGFRVVHIATESKEKQDATKEYALHISCCFSIKWNTKERVTFWGDSDKEVFENCIATLIGQEVQSVSLGKGNILHIELMQCSVEIFPADDDTESWRLFEPESDAPHLVAANSWLINS